jgi:hypothetical protein
MMECYSGYYQVLIVSRMPVTAATTLERDGLTPRCTCVDDATGRATSLPGILTKCAVLHMLSFRSDSLAVLIMTLPCHSSFLKPIHSGLGYCDSILRH